MSCHDEVLEAVQFLTRRSGRGTFSMADVVAEMQRRSTSRMLKKAILTFSNVANPAHVRIRSRQVKHLRARPATETSLSRTSRVFFNTLLGTPNRRFVPM